MKKYHHKLMFEFDIDSNEPYGEDITEDEVFTRIIGTLGLSMSGKRLLSQVLPPVSSAINLVEMAEDFLSQLTEEELAELAAQHGEKIGDI